MALTQLHKDALIAEVKKCRRNYLELQAKVINLQAELAVARDELFRLRRAVEAHHALNPARADKTRFP